MQPESVRPLTFVAWLLQSCAMLHGRQQFGYPVAPGRQLEQFVDASVSLGHESHAAPSHAFAHVHVQPVPSPGVAPLTLVA